MKQFEMYFPYYVIHRNMHTYGAVQIKRKKILIQLEVLYLKRRSQVKGIPSVGKCIQLKSK